MLTLLLLLRVPRLVVSFLGGGERRGSYGKLSASRVLLWEECDLYVAGFFVLTLGGHIHTWGYLVSFCNILLYAFRVICSSMLQYLNVLYKILFMYVGYYFVLF